MTQTALASVQEVRDTEFPHLKGCTFLNAASFGPLPRRTRAAVDGVLRLRDEPWRFAQYDLVEALDRCRRAAASLIGAAVDEIALAPNTTFGLNLAATLLPQACRQSDRRLDRSAILVSDREFPANVLPWLGLRRRGVQVEIMPTDGQGLPDEDAMVERLASGDVALLAISAVQFASGHRADLARLGAACRANGALFVVDAIQLAGAGPIDVRNTPIDILSCGAQKWLCGPMGAGFTYVSRDLCERLEPPLRGWLSTEASSDFSNLLNYDARLLDDARRFEQGSHALQDQVGLAESIELLLEVGIRNIAEHLRTILAPLHDWIGGTRRVRLASPRPGSSASAIVCVETREPARLYDGLTTAGVVCALREGALRFSPHFYNTGDEIDVLVRLLDELA